MSVEKLPLTDLEYNKLLKAATSRSEECKKIILLYRWAGMHESVLAEPIKYNLRVENDRIIWDRPKKKGKEAYTSIKISKNVDFDVSAFIDELKKRKRRISRQYFYDVVKNCGLEAGLKGISPMSLRHTLGVWMLNNGYNESDVEQTLNCSRKVLKTYVKHSPKTRDEKFDRLGW